MRFDGKRAGLALLTAAVFLGPVRVRAAEENCLICSGDQFFSISPFLVEHTVRTAGGEIFFSGTCAPRVFALTDGEDAFPAYSADPAAEMEEGARYHCVNLEDSGCFSDAAAGRIRAVLQGAYPWQQVETIQEAANDWLRARELPEIQELQSGEAILAAQIAVWKLAAGERYRVHSLYAGTLDLKAYEAQLWRREELSQQRTEFTPGNIESLYTYYCNQAPIEAGRGLLSDSTVTRTMYSGREDGAGGYTVEAAVTIASSIGEEDSLTLTARCGGESQAQPVSEPGEYRFVFSGLPERLPVELEIQGRQWGSDVYLFVGEGGQEKVQTLAGIWEGFLPVSWKRVLTPALLPLLD